MMGAVQEESFCYFLRLESSWLGKKGLGQKFVGHCFYYRC